MRAGRAGATLPTTRFDATRGAFANLDEPAHKGIRDTSTRWLVVCCDKVGTGRACRRRSVLFWHLRDVRRLERRRVLLDGCEREVVVVSREGAGPGENGWDRAGCAYR